MRADNPVVSTSTTAKVCSYKGASRSTSIIHRTLWLRRAGPRACPYYIYSLTHSLLTLSVYSQESIGWIKSANNLRLLADLAGRKEGSTGRLRCKPLAACRTGPGCG